MQTERRNHRRLTPVWRAVIEIAFIVFLFYSNLLMGEFAVSNGAGKSLAFALSNIFTRTNFLTASLAAAHRGSVRRASGFVLVGISDK
jgi:hypothetical protein